MRLEFPEKKHEQQYLEMIQEFSDNKEIIIPAAAILKEGETYDDFLQRIKDNKEGKNLKP
jgi:predicted acetyltransferase